jgi:hypothetical protein
MPYNKINKLRKWVDIINLTNQYYDYELTTYKSVWRKYIYPIYKIGYRSYMDIINSPGVESQLKKEIEKVSKKTPFLKK